MKKALWILAVLVIGLVAVYFALNWRGVRQVTAHQTAMNARIDEFIRAHPGQRPVVLGPAEEGNAVECYLAIERAWEPRPSWNLPDPGIDYTAPFNEVDDYLAGDPAAIPASLAAFVDAQAGMEAHVRDGLRKTLCDWNLADLLAHGPTMDIPNLVVLRSAANLLAVLAHRTNDPEEAYRLGLEAIGFGSDVVRHSSLIGAMIGIAIENIGRNSLLRSVRRFPPSRERGIQLANDVLALDAASGITFSDTFRVEQLGMETYLCSMCLGGHDAEGTAEGVRVWHYLLPWFFWSRELAAYHRFSERLFEASERPYAAMRSAVAEVEADLAASYTTVAAIALPNLTNAREPWDSSHARNRALAVLSVAAGVRHDTGAYPADAAALAAAWGRALPEDPYVAGETIRYRVDAGTGAAVAYGLGTDGTDDPGEPAPSDADRSGLTWRQTGSDENVGLYLAPAAR